MRPTPSIGCPPLSPEKTVEIIGLVNGAHKKGAPLEFLDDIFDVAYVNTITVDQLTAAAIALQEFHSSDVPQGIYEEFVYHSIEDRWEPAAVPTYTRGLIYGVERGLSPEKVALILMLDIRSEEAKQKTPGAGRSGFHKTRPRNRTDKLEVHERSREGSSNEAGQTAGARVEKTRARP